MGKIRFPSLSKGSIQSSVLTARFNPLVAYGSDERTFDGSRVSTEETLTSASAVPGHHATLLC